MSELLKYGKLYAKFTSDKFMQNNRWILSFWLEKQQNPKDTPITK